MKDRRRAERVVIVCSEGYNAADMSYEQAVKWIEDFAVAAARDRRMCQGDHTIVKKEKNQ